MKKLEKERRMIIDPNEMAADYIKCYKDKSRITFIEKYLSTFDATRGKKIPFKLFPRQRVFLETLGKVRNVVAIKPRQCGITTLTSAWATAACVFAPEDAPETILCVGNKLDLANQLITKIREFLTQVPRWYWGDEYYSPDPRNQINEKNIFKKDSKSELELFNGCRIIARSSAENAARGISAVSILIMDEAAFIENSAAVYATCAATMASNPNAKTVMVSTPNGHDELYYNTYKQALAHQNNFTAVEFRWYQDPRYNKWLKWVKKSKNTGKIKEINDPVIDKEGNVKYNEQHWRDMVQQGYSPASPWYEDMKKSFNNDPIKIAQELDVSFQGSANNVVAPEFIDKQRDINTREPLADFKDPMNDDTWFWKKPIDGHRYICACLPVGEKVLTQRGLVNVKDIMADDSLVTKEGELTAIKHRKYRDVTDERIVRIKVSNFIESVTMTWNHPVWVSLSSKYKEKKEIRGTKTIRVKYYDHHFDFRNADEIKKGSWLSFPNYYLTNIFNNDTFLKVAEDNGISKDLALVDDFWWYCGMWLAEGYFRPDTNYIQTTHNIDENDYQDRVKSVISNIFQKNYYEEKIADNHSCHIVFYDKEIKEILKNNFGHLSNGKFIKEWIKFIPEKYKLQLLKGYFDGDGCYSDSNISANSVSKDIINGIQDILMSIGILSDCFSRNEKKDPKGIYHQKSYVIKLNGYNASLFYQKIGVDKGKVVKKVRQGLYFSDDKKIIYAKVRDVSESKYSGKVYNFETESESHTFCLRGCATHNCDPSIGTSADRTAIEIIDMDGRDENGKPIVEQVAEYMGRKLGDDIGGMIYQYANLYNQAYVVVDATGGIGNSLILTLLNLGYKNFYYEDQNQKTYTIQNKVDKPLGYNNRLPGFHFQGNRYPVLTGFAGMVRSNEFKIRSTRVINELETWVFDDNGRMDHQSGAHDDSICALAMGLFVMKYTYNKLIETKHKDEAILNSYLLAGAMKVNSMSNNYDGKPITPKNGLPFYNEHTLRKTDQNFTDRYGNSCLWLFAGYY